MAYTIRLVPFTTWGTSLWHLTLWIENILLMIPLGILLYILWRPFRKIGWSLLAGFLFSLSIECIQLYTLRGKFETDDIMNNVFGTLIGFMICKGIKKILFGFISKKDVNTWKRET
ncbi:MAG: VanZ family protein [Clostridiales bacterium]|nr:VanZ family protein [Clostridiales bacterium]